MDVKGTAIFCFRRDLRFGDNIGLQRALEENQKVIPVFVFDPRQLEHHAYRSDRAFNFMLLALDRLKSKLEDLGSSLILRNGNVVQELMGLAGEYSADAIYLNRDYTPFSIQRDKEIVAASMETGLRVFQFNDALLNPPEACLKADGTPYTVFTPFYNNARQHPVMSPERSPHYKRLLSKGDIHGQADVLGQIRSRFHLPELILSPTALLDAVEELAEQQAYDVHRNDLAADRTSHLSSFLKFGVVSVRLVYQRLKEEFGADHPLIRQLYWRDFYSHIAYHFPQVFGQAFKPQYDAIPWRDDQTLFEAWCNGQTGYPIVDAGMRELNETGFMHNRARMITASFLVKDLHIDWRWGERYFASKLMDYDPALNNGNWQWAASTGCDAQPYFRIFNPWLQQKKFDPDCRYIKRWVPELRDLPAADIHKLKDHPIPVYSGMIVDHATASAQAKRMFERANRDHQ
jgi:deoxyribodipyrimidine photo-lyase